MHKSDTTRGVVAVLFGVFLAVVATASWADPHFKPATTPLTWSKIDVAPRIYHVTDTNGVERDIAPRCSGGPVCTIDPITHIPSCRKGNEQYSFYYRPGKEANKLVMFFDGGGACWNSDTCVKGNLGGGGVYRPEISDKSNPANFGGMFDFDNPSNPYRNWSMVVLPYCTGDLFWGSKEQVYTDETGLATGIVGGKVTIHHRGFDNFLFVRDWMKKRFSRRGDERLEKVLVTGSSAGGYGAAFVFPHLKQTFPNVKAYLMADAANGVITDEFLNVAVRGLDSSWDIQGNLAQWIPGMSLLPYAPAQHFANAYYFAVAAYFPNDRFSQFTTQFDVVQAFFYNTMLHQNDSSAWNTVPPDVYQDWVIKAATIMYTNAFNQNYRYYIGEGCNHSALTFSDEYYKQSVNHPVQFLDWFKALTSDTDPAWQNAQCFNCSTPPTEQEATACFLRTPG